jgi:hypothetical protein
MNALARQASYNRQVNLNHKEQYMKKALSMAAVALMMAGSVSFADNCAGDKKECSKEKKECSAEKKECSAEKSDCSAKKAECTKAQ